MAKRMTKQRAKEYAIAALLAALILWLLWLLFGIIQKEEIARTAVTDTKSDATALDSRQATLESNIAEFNTERGQEASLRETYGVAKPGEGVIIVVAPPQATSTPPVPWWQKMLGWFHL